MRQGVGGALKGRRSKRATREPRKKVFFFLSRRIHLRLVPLGYCWNLLNRRAENGSYSLPKDRPRTLLSAQNFRFFNETFYPFLVNFRLDGIFKKLIDTFSNSLTHRRRTFGTKCITLFRYGIF